MAELFQHSPDAVIVTVGGVDIVGFQEATFLDVERMTDTYTSKAGSLGDVVRTKVLDKRGKFTFTLQAQAPSNDILVGFAAEDERTQKIVAIQVKDLNSTLLIHTEEAWCMKWPKVERGKESGSCQWVFECAFLEINPGGNVR